MTKRIPFCCFLLIASLATPVRIAASADFESSIERIETSGGTKTLVGFAFRRSTTAPVRIAIYLDRPRGSKGSRIATIVADQRRDDVRTSVGSPTATNGFRWTIPANLANSGRRIYVYLDNNETPLRSRIAESDGGIVLRNTSAPFGYLEGVGPFGNGQVAWGSAWFPGIDPAKVRVDLYADNSPDGGGIFVGSGFVSYLRPELADKFGLIESKLGFAILVPTRFQCSGRRLFAYAADPNEQVIPLKSASDVTTDWLRIPFESRVAAGFETDRELSWSPRVSSPRRHLALSNAPWFQEGTLEDESQGGAGTSGSWIVSTTMETARMMHVRPDRSMNALLPQDPMFRLTAAPTDWGRFSFRLQLDKRSERTIDGIATNATSVFGGINDSFDFNAPDGPKPLVGENVFVDLEYRVLDLRTSKVAGIDPPRARFTIGAGTRFTRWIAGQPTAVSNFTELNLERTSSSDLCPTSGSASKNLNLPPGVAKNGSDPLGRYDLRHYWGSRFETGPGANNGEMVQIDRRAISGVIAESRTSDGWTQLRIPMSYLISSYDWGRRPSSWNAVEIGGIYCGVEIWGKGVMEVEIRNYRAWTVRDSGS